MYSVLQTQNKSKQIFFRRVNMPEVVNSNRFQQKHSSQRYNKQHNVNKKQAAQFQHSLTKKNKQVSTNKPLQKQHEQQIEAAKQQDTSLLTQVLALQFISALLVNEKAKQQVAAEDAAASSDCEENEAAESADNMAS